MDVGIGSFSDPEGLEGLAHFLGTWILAFPNQFFGAIFLNGGNLKRV